MIDIDKLDEKFGIEGGLGFVEQENGLVFMTVYNKYAYAEISLYGGHVTQYTPHNSFDILWLSPKSDFEVGKPIRGGIPVCFPWFGPHPENSAMPGHGFARLMYWDVIETESMPDDATRVALQLCSSDETKAYWPYEFKARLDIVVGKQLSVALSIQNTDAAAFKYTSALHTYYAISNIGNISINGLGNTKYYINTGNELFEQKEDTLEIDQEINRRYIDTENDCVINDCAFARSITAAKKGSKITVVWNPWEENCAKIGDMEPESYQEFVCVEAANACNDVIELSPNETHTTSIEVSSMQQKTIIGRDPDEKGFSVI